MARLNETNWIFGNGVHLEFPGGGDPLALPGVASAFQTNEGCATISDDNGDLLFYTDGSTLWDWNHIPLYFSLGGDSSSTHSAIIVPPAGGGVEYHVFAVGADTGSGPDAIMHSTYTATSTGVVSQIAQPMSIGMIPGGDATERLAATTHADCDKYWVVAQIDATDQIVSFLVDRDAGTTPVRPSIVVSSVQASGAPGDLELGQMKFSPDGNHLAYCDSKSRRVTIHGFDTATGVVTKGTVIRGMASQPYGLEFSPDSQLLYYTTHSATASDTGVYQASVPAVPPQFPLSHANMFRVSTDVPLQLQLAPNNRIYGALSNSTTLAVIMDPNQPGTACDYQSAAQDANNTILDVGGPNVRSGLPTFTRITDRCAAPSCDEIAHQVNKTLWEATGVHHESMVPCDHPVDDPWPHPADPARCVPLPLTQPEPKIFITHSDSDCDCLESDDVEVMSLTVCNPYSNLTLTNLIIQSLELVGPDGQPPTPLPDGTPSVQIAPIGPFCFGDIPPCTCVSRQFVMRLRGAVAGTYKLNVTAVCFSWQVAETQQRCFEFEVCAD